ncbi:MAG: TrmH family RNA methyltransferase [Desulfobacteraceae bacterium]|jgi:TrmH family RNA methyltransferase
MDKVTSIKDERVQRARLLKSRAGRKGSDLIFLEGIEIINWAIESSNLQIKYIIVEEKSTNLLTQLCSEVASVFSATAGILKKITDTNFLVPIVGVARHQNKNPPKSDFIIAFDNVKDFGNIGTIVRTGSAFGITDYLATHSDFDPYYRKTIEASRGRVLHSHFKCFRSPSDTVKHLRHNGFQIIVTSPYGSHIQSLVDLDERPIALVIGNETTGVCSELLEAADKTVSIPMHRDVESLNVGVAAGISLYELKIKWILTMIEKRIRATLGRQVNVLGQHIRTILDMELKQVGSLDSKQVVFLMVLQCDKVMPDEQIMKENGLFGHEFVAFLDPLINQGLVVHENGKVFVTERTENVLSKLWAIKDRAEQKILSCLSQEENAVFTTLMDRVVAHCEELIRNTNQQ